MDLPAGSKELEGSSAASISIGALGYAPRSRRVLDDFADEEALAWLSARQMLFTFNPHALIRREGMVSHGLHRVIRAVVLDASHTVTRAVDWEIADTRRYLWPLSGSRVLVHVGNELRVYTAGLEIERSLALSGPLAFVEIAPNGKLMAIATCTSGTPRNCMPSCTASWGEPEEDIEVATADERLNTIARASTASGLQPPTLLNEGRYLLAQSKMHYRLALTTWDNKPVTLARLASRRIARAVERGTRPAVSAFVQRCHRAQRIPRAGGRRQAASARRSRSARSRQDVAGSQERATFAMKAVLATHELVPGIQFKATDLESEELRVYRASDGRRLLAACRRADHEPWRIRAFARWLAACRAFSQSEIQFFALPSE